MSNVDLNKQCGFYCINLPAARERRETVAAQAAAHRLDLRFVEAVPGTEIPADCAKRYDAETRARRWRGPLIPNEIACVLSHRKALEIALASNKPMSVIFEDDVILNGDFAQKLQHLLQAADAFEIIRLETRLMPSRRDLTVVGAPEIGQIVLARKWTLGAAAILYSRSGVEKAFRATERFSEAYDNIISRPWALGARVYEIRPPIAVESGAPSTMLAFDPAATVDSARNKMRFTYRIFISFAGKAVRFSSALRLLAARALS